MAKNATLTVFEAEQALPGLLYEIIERYFSPSSPLLKRMHRRSAEELYQACLFMAYCKWLKEPENEHLANNMETFAYFERSARPYRENVKGLLRKLRQLLLN